MNSNLAAPARPMSAPRWQWLLRLLLPAGMLLFAGLLFNAVQQLDWQEIRAALMRFEGTQIGIGMALALLTHAAASNYELLSRAHLRHAIPAPTCLGIGFVAYSLSASLSALLGNWGARYRLYGQRGLPFATITRIAVSSIGTHWSGFVLLAGLAFLCVPPALPVAWPLPEALLRSVGIALVACAAAYLLWCHRAAGRAWQLGRIRFTAPTLPLAAAQMALSVLVWTALALLISNFMPAKAGLLMIMPVLFLSTVAGLVLRLPAGVGVTEVVFVAVLGSKLGTTAIIAGLLAYRAVYQLLPVLLGALVYLCLEWRGRRLPPLADAPGPAEDAA